MYRNIEARNKPTNNLDQLEAPLWSNSSYCTGSSSTMARCHWRSNVAIGSMGFLDGFWQIPQMCGPFCDLASLTQSLKSSGAYMISIYLNGWDTHSRFTVVQISPKPEKDTERRSWTCCAMTPDIRSGRMRQNQGRYGGAQAYLQSWLCDPDTSCASTDVI